MGGGFFRQGHRRVGLAAFGTDRHGGHGGSQGLLGGFGRGPGSQFLLAFYGQKVQKIGDQYDAITIPDYLEGRFKSKNHLLRILSASTLVVFVTIYISAQIDATGAAFESFFGINYFLGAIVGFAIVVVYTFAGGLVAVAWCDLFQGTLMLLGLVGLPIVALWTIFQEPTTGGLSLFAGISRMDPALLSLWGRGGPSLVNLMVILSFLMIGIGFLGSPQIFVRFLAIKSEKEIRKGTWVAIIFTILTDSSAVLAGLLGRYLLSSSSAKFSLASLGNGAQDVLPKMVEFLFHPFFSGHLYGHYFGGHPLHSGLTFGGGLQRPDSGPLSEGAASRFAGILLGFPFTKGDPSFGGSGPFNLPLSGRLVALQVGLLVCYLWLVGNRRHLLSHDYFKSVLASIWRERGHHLHDNRFPLRSFLSICGGGNSSDRTLFAKTVGIAPQFCPFPCGRDCGGEVVC